MGIMDFVLIGIAVLFAVIGLVKGGAKLLLGFFMFLVIAVGCAFAASALSPVILMQEKDGSTEFTSAATFIADPIADALPTTGKAGDFFADTVSRVDGTPYVGETTVKEALSQSIPFGGDFVYSLTEKYLYSGHTLKDCLAFTAVKAIWEVAIWLVLLIILLVVRNILRKKLFRWLDANPTPSKIDRVIGLVLNLAIAVVIIWAAGAMIAKADDGDNWAHKADNFLTDGAIAEPFMTNNPFLKLIDVSLPVETTVTEK